MSCVTNWSHAIVNDLWHLHHRFFYFNLCLGFIEKKRGENKVSSSPIVLSARHHRRDFYDCSAIKLNSELESHEKCFSRVARLWLNRHITKDLFNKMYSTSIRLHNRSWLPKLEGDPEFRTIPLVLLRAFFLRRFHRTAVCFDFHV